MKKSFLTALIIILLCTFGAGSGNTVSAALADGKYTVDYVIKKADDESVSMANDYFEKPATMSVSGGKIKVSFQLNHSKWITKFQVPGGNNKVIASNKKADTQVMEFEVKDIDQPVISKIHVTVPSSNYDHDYTIRFVFDTGSMKAVAGAATPAKKPKATATSAERSRETLQYLRSRGAGPGVGYSVGAQSDSKKNEFRESYSIRRKLLHFFTELTDTNQPEKSVVLYLG